MPLWLVRCSPLSENPVPTTLSILHWLNMFCCTRQLGTFLFPLGSQSSRLQAAEIYRGRHLLLMVAEAARHSVAPTDSIEEHLLDSNLSKVSTDANSNPEYIKPKGRGMPYYKDNHICVHGSDYQFAKSLSCTMRNVDQNARICSSWEHGWRYATSLTSFCVETIVSSIVLMVTFLPVSHACMQSDR